jgi:hypothetical protein
MSQQINIDVAQTKAVVSSAGTRVFAKGVLLRKVSRFVTGSSEDTIIEIPVHYCILTQEVMYDLLPPDLAKLLKQEHWEEASEND